MVYRANKNYPPIKVKEKNIKYAKILAEDYAGINGEITAITLYVYQNMGIFTKYPNIAKHLLNIAIVEMRHLEILGKLIFLLGLNPRYITYQRDSYCNWDSSYVDYDLNINRLLKKNILAEKIAIKNYKKHIDMINDYNIKIILERIIEDENVHINCFKMMLIKEKECIDI